MWLRSFLIVLILATSWAASQAQDVISIPLCWDVDSSIYKLVYYSPRTPNDPKVLAHIDAYGDTVDVSAGGRFWMGNCAYCTFDTLPVPRIENFQVSEPVQNPFNPTRCASSATAQVYGVTDPGTQITLTIDGSPLDFMFDTDTQTLLSEIVEEVTGSGVHTIALTVTIPSGTVMASDTFDCGS